MSTALRTDRYELTMLDAALLAGVASRRAVFEVFARSLPEGRRFGVVAGTGRLLEALSGFRFAADELAFLEREQVVSGATLDWLESFRLSASIDAYGEGECYFASSPVLTVEAPLGEGLLLETLVLSVVNSDSAVASAAARMVAAAGGRQLVEMGSRRVNEEVAPASARAAYVAGFSSTSNLEAGRRYGVPTAGTASHAFTLAFGTEPEAFDAQLAASGTGTTLLVDTFDLETGIEHAVLAARHFGAPGPGAVRIDSGDLASAAALARGLLDRLGAVTTRIVVSSDLDEHVLAALAGAPVDAYGVGTSVATGSGAPSAGFVYKLVAIADSDEPEAPMRPVAKRSAGKEGVGGRKAAYRVLDSDGVASGELLARDGDLDGAVGAAARLLGGPRARWRPLQRPLVSHGEVVGAEPIDAARSRCRASLDELGAGALDVRPGPPAVTVELVSQVVPAGEAARPGG